MQYKNRQSVYLDMRRTPSGKDLFCNQDRYRAVQHSLKTVFLLPSCVIAPMERCQPSEHDQINFCECSNMHNDKTCRISETSSLQGNSETSYSSIFSSSSPVSNSGLGFFDILVVVMAALITITSQTETQPGLEMKANLSADGQLR